MSIFVYANENEITVVLLSDELVSFQSISLWLLNTYRVTLIFTIFGAFNLLMVDDKVMLVMWVEMRTNKNLTPIQLL